MAERRRGSSVAVGLGLGFVFGVSVAAAVGAASGSGLGSGSDRTPSYVGLSVDPNGRSLYRLRSDGQLEELRDPNARRGKYLANDWEVRKPAQEAE